MEDTRLKKSFITLLEDNISQKIIKILGKKIYKKKNHEQTLMGKKMKMEDKALTS